MASGKADKMHCILIDPRVWFCDNMPQNAHTYSPIASKQGRPSWRRPLNSIADAERVAQLRAARRATGTKRLGATINGFHGSRLKAVNVKRPARVVAWPRLPLAQDGGREAGSRVEATFLLISEGKIKRRRALASSTIFKKCRIRMPTPLRRGAKQ